MEKSKTEEPGTPAGPSLMSLLKPYWLYVAVLVVLAVASNALNLATPKIVSHAIDSFVRGQFELGSTVIVFTAVITLIFVLTYLQSIVQTYASEIVARDLRNDLAEKISRQSFLFVQNETPAKLLTNLTSDIDGIKLFVSQAIVTLVSSLFLVLGASVLLIAINWKLALVVLLVVPLIGGTFFYSFSRVKVLFTEAQKVIDWLNKVINESILGSALIRVLNSQKYEYDKFLAANTEATNVGMKILGVFAGLIPLITFFANLAMLAILVLGGHYIINGALSLGDFAAFTSYLAILIFPIIMIGFMSSVMARASASYTRVAQVLSAPEKLDNGTLTTELRGAIEIRNVSMMYGEKNVLKDVSLGISPGNKIAIIGPTAAGKTQLLYALTGLTVPTKGDILYDGQPISAYDRGAFYRQIGLVFQDSIMFALSLRENIAFSDAVTEESLALAIQTAELSDFVDALPEGLQTTVTERGTSLSGGQKQRIMLARALAQSPKILFLDDFTARVDALTEEKILANVAANYPDMTLVSVTQKISSVEHYDKIVLLMEGEVLAEGTHEELMMSSPEYVQIYESQKSTSHYELPAE
jgi:ATP-binding cassette subfamily B protein